jgi:hypothetical protein
MRQTLCELRMSRPPVEALEMVGKNCSTHLRLPWKIDLERIAFHFARDGGKVQFFLAITWATMVLPTLLAGDIEVLNALSRKRYLRSLWALA